MSWTTTMFLMLIFLVIAPIMLMIGRSWGRGVGAVATPVSGNVIAWTIIPIGVVVLGYLAFQYLPAPTIPKNVAITTVLDIVLGVVVAVTVGALIVWSIYAGNLSILKWLAIGLVVVAFIGVGTIGIMRDGFHNLVVGDSSSSWWNRSSARNCETIVDDVISSAKWSKPFKIGNPQCGVLGFARDDDSAGVLKIMANGDERTIRTFKRGQVPKFSFPVVSVQFKLVEGPPVYVATGSVKAVDQLRETYNASSSD